MATGGGGANNQMAAAYVRLYLEDRDYHRNLGRALTALRKFGSSASSIGASLRMTGVTSQLTLVTKRVDSLSASLIIANRNAARLHATLLAIGRSRASSGHILPSSISAIIGSTIRSTLSGGGSLFKGISQGLTTIMKGSVSSFGSLMKDGARSFGIIWKDVFLGTIRSGVGLMRGVAGTFRSMASSIRALLGSFRMVGGIGAGLGVIGSAFSIAKILQAASKFETEVVNLRRVSEGDIDDRQFGGVVGGLKGLARRSPGVGLDKIMQVASLGAKMGLPTSELRLFTNDLTKLGAIFDEADISLADATERIGSMLSVFRLGSQNAIRLGSALVKLDNVSVASARDILDVANRFSASAAIFNMTPQQTLALATAMKQAKIPTETAGTNMQQIMMRMARIETAPEFARIAGMSPRQFLNTLQTDPMQAIMSTVSGISGMDPIEANRALDRLRLDGQRARNVMLSLAQVIELIPEYTAAANAEWEKMGTVMGGFARQSDTLAAQWALTKNNLTLMSIELGRVLLPAAKGVSNAIRRIAEDLTKAVESKKLEEWGNSLKSTIESIPTMFSNSGTWFEIMSLTFEDEVERMAGVFARFVTALPKMILDITPRLGMALFEMGKKSVMSIASGIAGAKVGVGAFGIDRLMASAMELMGIIPEGSASQVDDVVAKSKQFGPPKWLTDQIREQNENPFKFSEIFGFGAPGRNADRIAELRGGLDQQTKDRERQESARMGIGWLQDRYERWRLDREEEAKNDPLGVRRMSPAQRAIARSRALRARRWGGLENEPGSAGAGSTGMSRPDIAASEAVLRRRAVAAGPGSPEMKAIIGIERQRYKDTVRQLVTIPRVAAMIAWQSAKEARRKELGTSGVMGGPSVPSGMGAALGGLFGLGGATIGGATQGAVGQLGLGNIRARAMAAAQGSHVFGPGRRDAIPKKRDVGSVGRAIGGLFGPIGTAIGGFAEAALVPGEERKARRGGIGFGSRPGTYQAAAADYNRMIRSRRDQFNAMMSGRSSRMAGAGFVDPKKKEPKKTTDDVHSVLTKILEVLKGKPDAAGPGAVAMRNPLVPQIGVLA
jgi:TP901 family phage tail tape measure protein